MKINLIIKSINIYNYPFEIKLFDICGHCVSLKNKRMKDLFPFPIKKHRPSYWSYTKNLYWSIYTCSLCGGNKTFETSIFYGIYEIQILELSYLDCLI